MNSQIKQIQDIELSLYYEFKRICDKYKLRYFGIGGTCIGAVRHKGFIPWDDDIDIAMPYRDYKKFQQIALKELPEYYSLFLPEHHRHWGANFMKLQDDRSTFIECDRLKWPEDYTGVFIDIMPIYGMPKGKTLQYMASLLCEGLLFCNVLQRYSIFEQKSLFRKIIWIFNAPIRKLMPFNYYIKIIEKIFGKYSFEHSDKIIFGWRKRPGRIHKNYTYQNVFYYNDFKEMTELLFENTAMAVPCGYDQYLKMDFGDYMKLPPEEKRVSEHKTAIINLDKSYKEYMN